MKYDPAKSARAGLLRDIGKNRFSYLIALPALVYVFVFSYFSYPYIAIAFQRYSYQNTTLWSIFSNGNWIGLQNFKFFFESQYASRITFNTVYLNLLFIITGTMMSVLLALFLNELRTTWFTKLTQSVMLFPNYISWIIVSYMVLSLFSNQFGIVNQLTQAMGGKAKNWYVDANVWPAILVVVRIWKGAGMSAVIYLAAIAGIDSTLHEAGQIDGANRFQIATKITLPLITPTIIIMTLLAVGKIMFGDFGMIYALVGDNGTLYRTTDIIDTYVFRALRQIGDPSQAMAISLFQSVIGFIMVFGSNALVRKLNPDGALY
jgi:putative aldouronate transport system permease protein